VDLNERCSSHLLPLGVLGWGEAVLHKMQLKVHPLRLRTGSAEALYRVRSSYRAGFSDHGVDQLFQKTLYVDSWRNIIKGDLKFNSDSSTAFLLPSVVTRGVAKPDIGYEAHLVYQTVSTCAQECFSSSGCKGFLWLGRPGSVTHGSYWTYNVCGDLACLPKGGSYDLYSCSSACSSVHNNFLPDAPLTYSYGNDSNWSHFFTDLLADVHFRGLIINGTPSDRIQDNFIKRPSEQFGSLRSHCVFQATDVDFEQWATMPPGCLEPPCLGNPCGIVLVIDYLFDAQLCSQAILDGDHMTVLGLCPRTCNACEESSRSQRWMDIISDPRQDVRHAVICDGPTSISCGEHVLGNTDSGHNDYGRSSNERSYWFQASDTSVRFDLNGSSFDTHLATYDSNYWLVARNDDRPPDPLVDGLDSLTSRISLNPQKGNKTYLIVIEGSGSSDSGQFTLEVTCL